MFSSVAKKKDSATGFYLGEDSLRSSSASLQFAALHAVTIDMYAGLLQVHGRFVFTLQLVAAVAAWAQSCCGSESLSVALASRDAE